MKINKNYRMVGVAGEYILVPVGEESKNFHGVVALNEAAAFLFAKIEAQMSKEDIIKALIDEYDVDERTARLDVEQMIEKLIESKVLEA